MGILARDMQRAQVRELMAALPPSDFPQTDREKCKSAIQFFVLLQKRTGTNEAFLNKLEDLLVQCNSQNFLSEIDKFKQENPDFLSEEYPRLTLPNGTGSGFKPTRVQSERFRSTLLRISRTITKKQLEIMVGLSPTPEAGKEKIDEVHELFEQMERHGCISENDTEMLQEILELFSLKDAIGFLNTYRHNFPPQIHSPQPSAPIYVSPPVSMLAQPGSSLPQGGSQYNDQSHSSQPSHHSLPVGASGYSQHYPSISVHQPPSMQPPSWSSSGPSSAPMSGGSSFVYIGGPSSGPSSAPVPAHPHQESGETKSDPNDQRHFVPSTSPPSERANLSGTVRRFVKVSSGSSMPGHASSPPGHAPLSSSGSSNVYPRKRARGQGAGTPSSSGVFPRSREGEGHANMPPPSKFHRPESHHSGFGDGCLLSTMRGRRQNEDGSEVAAAAATAQHHTLSTASSYTGDSEKFNTPVEQSPASHQSAPGSSQESVPSFVDEHSFSAGVQPHSANFHDPPHLAAHPPPPPPQAQAHSSSGSLPSYNAGSLGLPVGEQAQPSLPSLPDEAGSLPSNASSLPSHEDQPNFPAPIMRGPQQLHGNTGSMSGNAERSQFRSAPGQQAFLRPAHHPDDLAHQLGGHDHQPFIQQGGHSAQAGPPSNAPSASVGVSMSTLGSYTGPTSGEFMPNVSERGHNPMSSSGFPPQSSSPSYSSPPQHQPGRRALSKEDAMRAHGASNFESINVAASARNQPRVANESQLPASGNVGHHLPSSQVYGQPVTPERKGSTLNKREARNIQGGAPFVSLNQSVGGQERLKMYHKQLQERLVSERGKPLAQASSERNMELQGEQQQSAEDVPAFQTAQSGPTPSSSLYPTLPPLDTATETMSLSGATPSGGKRTRNHDKEVESRSGEEERQGAEEEESSPAKRQKTGQSEEEVRVKKEPGQRVTRSKAKKKPGMISRAFKYLFGSKEDPNSTEGETDEQSKEESNTNTESESEYHDAQEY